VNGNDHLLAAVYALGALDPDEATRFEAHLESCASCRTEVSELTATAAVLAEGTAEPVPDRLRSQTMHQMRLTPQLPPRLDPPAASAGAGTGRAPEEADVHARRRRATVAWFAVAAAVVVALLAGSAVLVGRGRPADSGDVASVLDQPDHRAFPLQGDLAGAATVHLAPGNRQGAVIATGLPPVGAQDAYELWVINQAGPHRATVFRPDDQGTAQTTFTIPADPVDSLAVTVEPAAGSDAPTGPIVLQTHA
jgi:anti-sigma-K factor RskA